VSTSKYKPRRGQRYAKVVKIGKHRAVHSRTVIAVRQGWVTYTPKRKTCLASPVEWAYWVRDARLCKP